VWKAPANEKLLAAAGLQRAVKTAEQEVLNPEGVNCIRQFDKPRGIRVWGARTLSSDPELKYVNTIRYRNYLTASLERGLAWTGFEPNAEQLWANVRRTVADFLFNEWQSGALLGDKPEQAYFVRCDRSTMTQNDLDNGRLVCMIGVAQLKPAEYIILRIGQMTADARQP
jgi:phage tail sheath protein FI